MLAPGDILQSRYAIESLIGAGGMGRVYLSRQTMLRGLRVALKEVAFDTVHPDDRPAAVESFRREAETLAALSHPNLVQVKDCFEENDKVYLVMEYVAGPTLDELVARDGPLPLKSVVEYARQLCTVLLYLHNSDPVVIFRDLKPSNVMLDASGIVRLVDFGLAETPSEHVDGLAQGTPGYAPIEQLLAIGLPCDERSDIYALGATLYHLLTGRAPSDACSRMIEDTVVPPSELSPEVPGWLSDGILHMLALRPEHRFATVLEIRDHLDRHHQIRATWMAPVLPILEGRSLPRIEAFLRDGLGRPFDIQIFDFGDTWIRFCCEDRRWIRRPRDVYFVMRGQREPARVPVAAFDATEVDGHQVYEVQLHNPPLSVLRVLRDGIRPAASLLQRERNALRFEVELPVAIPEVLVDGEAVDMSVSGCRLVTCDPLPLGRRLTAWINLQDVVLPDVEVVAEVRWCRARWRGGYEAGLVFTEVEERTIDVMNLYFEQHARTALTA